MSIKVKVADLLPDGFGEVIAKIVHQFTDPYTYPVGRSIEITVRGEHVPILREFVNLPQEIDLFTERPGYNPAPLPPTLEHKIGVAYLERRRCEKELSKLNAALAPLADEVRKLANRNGNPNYFDRNDACLRWAEGILLYFGMLGRRMELEKRRTELQDILHNSDKTAGPVESNRIDPATVNVDNFMKP